MKHFEYPFKKQAIAYTVGLPNWLSCIRVRETASKWIVNLHANTFSVDGCRNDVLTVRFSKHLSPNADCARHYATHLPTARKVKAASKGCWILSKIKQRFTLEERAELFSGLCADLKRKYDGEHYLYESEASQAELIAIFKLGSMEAENFLPVRELRKTELAIA